MRASRRRFLLPIKVPTKARVAMGFYNMSQGDAPVFKFIADHYAMSDNFHQGIMGGTGASFIYLGTGDLAYYSDGNGNPAMPPAQTHRRSRSVGRFQQLVQAGWL